MLLKTNGQKMRLKADTRISTKNNVTGKFFKIELIIFPTNSRRRWLRFNDVNFKKSPDVTLTQLYNRLRRLLKLIDQGLKPEIFFRHEDIRQRTQSIKKQ